MAALAAKNDCNFNEFVRIISGLNVESIANINFTQKINMFRTLAIDCMIKETKRKRKKNRKKRTRKK